MSELPFLEVKVNDEYSFDLPSPTLKPKTPQNQPQSVPEPVSNFPKTVSIKTQRRALPWHEPEQEFNVVSFNINKDTMEQLDEFLNKNLPKDLTLRNNALKFVENVFLGTETKSFKVFEYHQYKLPGFMVCFDY